MTRVVLVWNEHPTEVVAGFHCRAVAKLLQEMGHEVIVEKIPVKETNYALIREVDNGLNLHDTAVKLAELPESAEIAQRFAIKHDAPVFNFHASEVARMGKAREKQPIEFTLGEIDYGKSDYVLGFPFELTIEPRGRAHVVELPGVQINLSGEKREQAEKRISQIRRTVEESKTLTPFQRFSARRNAHAFYHSQRMALTDKQQQKYKAEAISEKIAQAIHKRITRQK